MVISSEGGAMKFDLTHVRHDPAHCLAPGLFRSLKRGDRKKLKLDVTYDYGEEKVRFIGFEPLGADDLRVLQGLIAMSGPSGLILRPEPKTQGGQQLRLRLDPKWDAVDEDALVIKGSYTRLAREIGYGDSGKSFALIRDCIERLWSVSVIVEKDGRRHGFRILSEYASDERDGQLFVALNPRLAQAVTGGRPFTRINLDEVRDLTSDPARLIHQRLCGWIDPGKSGRVSIDAICGYVWPGLASPEAMKKRRQTARKALSELVAVGWTVSEYSKGKWKIERPKAL